LLCVLLSPVSSSCKASYQASKQLQILRFRVLVTQKTFQSIPKEQVMVGCGFFSFEEGGGGLGFKRW